MEQEQDKNQGVNFDSPRSAGKVAPKNYFIPSILATVLCCPPIGILGIINAARVERLFANGEYDAAQRSSDNAKKWIKVSILAWVACVAIYMIVVALFLDKGLPY